MKQLKIPVHTSSEGVAANPSGTDLLPQITLHHYLNLRNSHTTLITLAKYERIGLLKRADEL